MNNFQITHTQEFEEIGNIFEIIPIKESEQLLLAGWKGLLKATKDHAIKHFFKENPVISICHVSESLYLLGFGYNGFVVWNEQTNQQLFFISQDRVFSIKRHLTTNTYIIKTFINGLKILTIKNLKK